MAGQRIPGPIGTDTEPTVRIDSGTSARMATPPPGGICSTPDDGLKGPAYTLDLHALGWVDSVRAAQVVGRALNESWDHVARIVRQETDVVIDALVDLILPILALGIAVLVAGVVFSGGVFALGLALLEWLGLGFLAVEIGCALAVVGGYTSRGARRAVNSLFVLPHQRSEELTLAATDFARAQAELIKAVLMGIVALLLKNSAVTSSRKAGLPELLGQLRTSRLGEGFAGWLEANWQALMGNAKLRPWVQRSTSPPRSAEIFTPSQLAKRAAASPDQQLPVPTPPRPARIDYSRGFEDDLINFKPGYQLMSGPLKEDLTLVSYHSNVPLGQGRTAKWWTTPQQGNAMGTVEQVHQSLALPPEWGAREAVTVIRIPKGTDITAYVGEAAPQIGSAGDLFAGGGRQFRFKDFDTAWIVSRPRVIPQ